VVQQIMENLALPQLGRARAQLRDRHHRAERILRALHNRMPVVLAPEAWPAWLGEEPADAAHLKTLLAPYPADDMICWPVSPRVGNVKNNDPSLIEPITAAG
jgi:putative SOS response-associated peptidase YedK